MKKIVIRADDLGYSEAVNLGIYKSVHDGLVSNVGLMSNMKYATHGVKLLENEKVCLGQHINISVGQPVTDISLIPSLIDENGFFRKSKDYMNAKEDIVLQEAIKEVEAQYLRFIEIVGRKPAYLDGHAIQSVNFFKAIEIVAEKYGLKYSPFSSSFDTPVTIGSSSVYLNCGSDINLTCFECLKKIIEQDEKRLELIIYHPGYLDAFIMKNSSLNIPRVYELEMLCDEDVKAYISKQNVELITFDEL